MKTTQIGARARNRAIQRFEIDAVGRLSHPTQLPGAVFKALIKHQQPLVIMICDHFRIGDARNAVVRGFNASLNANLAVTNGRVIVPNQVVTDD
ncbi:MAG: hypothetical protein HKN70_02090 [Gammaproteobacteria bacterium]|nr:hypothetical protein [Gammaproteobacteria bacterium]